MSFVVTQRYDAEQQHALNDLTEARLGFWLQGHFFDARTETTLRKVAAQNVEASRLTQRVAQLDIEREKLHVEQRRLRENLQALGDRHGEKELRDRFVRTLGTQEDRLEAIEREADEAAKARDACREQVEALLAGLDYEAAVG